MFLFQRANPSFTLSELRRSTLGLAMRSRPDHRKGDPALANDRGGAD